VEKKMRPSESTEESLQDAGEAELVADMSNDHLSTRPAIAVMRGATRRQLRRWAEKLPLVLVVFALFWLLAAPFGGAIARGLRALEPSLLIGFAGSVLLTVVGVRAGSRAALLAAALFGVPLNLPWPFGERGSLLRAKANWLAKFLSQPPRGYNTVGAHVACGVIALKRELKRLCLREEAASTALSELRTLRSSLLDERRQLMLHVARLLSTADRAAATYGRRAFALGVEIDALDARTLHLRLDIQRDVVAEFSVAWRGLLASGQINREVHHSVREQLEQPAGEAEALLANGLAPSKLAYLFEYGMFAGRAILAYVFIATFDTSYLLLSVGLLALNLYVIEPVVQKLHISTFNLLLDSPGHKLLDVKRYLKTALPANGLFRVPITVPKFSSNPAWNNLQALINSALSVAGARPIKVVPFAIRDGNKDTVLEFASSETPERLLAIQSALSTELARNRAKFPLDAEVVIDRARVIIRLLEDEKRIWELVGEDASQAFIYLRRNLEGMRDTLAHLGPKFQPVFLFCSNTKDPDVVKYEIDHLAELQDYSDRCFSGQVGFLHLLRGGQWYNFNSHLRTFDAADKDFVRALPEFKRRFAEDEFPAKSYLLKELGEGRAPQDFARAFNRACSDAKFYETFSAFAFDSLPPELRPTPGTWALLERARQLTPLTAEELRNLNRELLLTAVPAKIRGDFFKKVGNDIAVQELIVAGKTRPTMYLDRTRGEHVQDPSQPNFVGVRGDFARYTGLCGTNDEICAAILAGRDIPISDVPEVGAILDDKNDFAAGELEKGVAIFLHPENRHIVIGVPRINITLPEHRGAAITSEYILGARIARDCHNVSDSRSKAAVYAASSAAFGKWLHRPRAYLAHYAREVLNPAHALSHDFQQSYLVAGAAGRLGGFSEALYGPSRFHATVQKRRVESSATKSNGWRRPIVSLLTATAHRLTSLMKL
jgi:hypothetical protein